MKKISGFTILELLFTLLVASIILSLGVPAFQDMIRNNRIASQTNDVLSTLNLARSEAIKRGRRVVLCKSDKIDDLPTCTTAGNCCSTETGDWEKGWIVFVDANNDAVLDAADTVLRVHGALEGDSTLQGTATMANYISYAPDGATRLAGGGNFLAGTLTLGLCNSVRQRNTIVISSAGRARVEKVSC